MKRKVNLKNPKSGEIISIKVGFSWTCFWFNQFFGIPLFLRKLNLWGGIMAGIAILNFAVGASEYSEGKVFVGIVTFGLNIFFAVKANSMAAKNYLENGWVFEDQPEAIQFAKKEWNLAA